MALIMHGASHDKSAIPEPQIPGRTRTLGWEGLLNLWSRQVWIKGR